MAQLGARENRITCQRSPCTRQMQKDALAFEHLRERGMEREREVAFTIDECVQVAVLNSLHDSPAWAGLRTRGWLA